MDGPKCVAKLRSQELGTCVSNVDSGVSPQRGGPGKVVKSGVNVQNVALQFQRPCNSKGHFRKKWKSCKKWNREKYCPAMLGFLLQMAGFLILPGRSGSLTACPLKACHPKGKGSSSKHHLFRGVCSFGWDYKHHLYLEDHPS